MELIDFRNKIDLIDDEIIRLFAERMEVSSEIATYKLSKGLAVYDARREEAKVTSLEEKANPEIQKYIRPLYERIFELSRERQNELISNSEMN